MANYNSYIELSPHYESVVDIDSENRNPNMWQEYIVHEDMKDALDKICQSLSFEDMNKRRSFWVHGAYGTGKSYAAIVLKHLFEDPVDSIRPFLSKQLLIPYRDAFIAQREKGKYLVVWKSQTTDIKSGTQLMMAVELAIREKLKEEFGDKAYYGKKSLTAGAKEAVNKTSINWQDIFDNSPLGLCDDYESLDAFKAEVEAGNLKACNLVAKIFRDNGWGFFTVIEDFKAWLKDIIEGNNLQDTGIIFIWDEFTTYLRDNPNDDVLQPLSEYCKEQPFFMCLIVHKDSSWLSNVGEDTYNRIVHRYHSMEFHVSEGAAYELIGNSILVRAGMEDQWNTIRDNLMKSISKNLADFDQLDLSNKKDRFRQLCPLHPMTLSMLAIVAQNFGASQRTLFRFMKDRKESAQNVGFIYYINNFGYDNWRWLTTDFLWDYFFMRESDVKNFSTEAKSAYQHFVNKKEFISDDYHMRVFKAAMLLIAVMSSGNVSNLYSQATQRKVAATRSTLYKCFVGILTKDDVNNYLNDLCEIGLLRLDVMTNGDARLQIPYTGTGSGDVFEYRKQMIMAKNTRYELFKKGGVFAKAIEGKISDKNDAAYSRIYVAASSSDTSSINNRRDEIQTELAKNPYKFGLLIIAIDEASKFSSMQEKIKQIAAADTTGRFAVCILKSPLTDDHLDRWYNARTHSELAGDEGKSGDAERYSQESDVIVSEWSESAGDDQIMAVCGTKTYPSEYGAYSLMANLKKDIIFGSVFTAAPEQIVKTNTAFKKMQATTTEAGIKKTSPNTQVGNIVNGLKTVGVWDAETLAELTQATGNDGAKAIATIASYISEKFAQGTQIKLDELWMELQKPPYGYYNCMACGYILGFVLRHYVNSEFSWNKGDNNPWPFTEKNIAIMINDMCSGKTVNHYLSPGSEIWQKFKPYVKRVFKLSDGEAVNETEARKYMSKQCTEKAGVPFWSLEYLPEEKFGGASAKTAADEIISLFCDFMSETGDQESVMGDITVKFTGKGQLRKTLTELYFDQNTVYEAFSNFISQKRNELQDLRTEIGLTNLDLFDAIHQLMQGQVSTWTEQQVEEKVEELCIEYRAVAALNKALGLKRKSIKQLSDDMNNAFDNMIVPGSVIETLGYDWIPTLKAMRTIATTQWSKIEAADRMAYTDLISSNAKTVWGNVTSSKAVLKKYMDAHGHSCTDEELTDIFSSLKASKYDASTTDFDNKIASQLNKIAYNRNKIRINELWLKQSGFNSVTEWCNNWAVPVQWVVSDVERDHIAILHSVQSGKTVNDVSLNNATQYFENNTVYALKDKSKIMDCFFTQVGENYRVPFEASATILVSRLKTNQKLTSDVYSWAHKIGDIRHTIDEFLRSKYCEDAKKEVRKMDADKLRDKVVELLETNPDLYTMFIK